MHPFNIFGFNKDQAVLEFYMKLSITDIKSQIATHKKQKYETSKYTNILSFCFIHLHLIFGDSAMFVKLALLKSCWCAIQLGFFEIT